MDASRKLEFGKTESASGSNTKLNVTQEPDITQESLDKAVKINTPKRLALKVKSWGRENNSDPRVVFPIVESTERRIVPSFAVQRTSTESDERKRRSTTSSRKANKVNTKAILSIIESMEQKLSDTDLDQDYKEYLIERRQLLLEASSTKPRRQIVQLGQPAENIWQRLEVIFDSVRIIEQGLTDSPEDERYRQHLFKTGLLLDPIPSQYLNHLKKIRESISMSDPPSDPWIQNWSNRRLTTSNYNKRYLIQRWIGIISGKLDRVIEDTDDIISFGKRACIMEFSDRNGVLFRGTPPAPPTRIRPRVSAVISLDSLYTKRRLGIRWIHLPANNMSWVEVGNLSPFLVIFSLTRKGSYQKSLRKHFKRRRKSKPFACRPCFERHVLVRPTKRIQCFFQSTT